MNLIQLAPSSRGRVKFGLAWMRFLLAERSTDSPPVACVEWQGPNGTLSAEIGDLSQLRAIGEVFGDEQYAAPGLTEPRTIVDLGANAGIAVLYFKARWPNARVIAVEPHPETFQRLIANTRHLSGVELVHAAVTKTSGPVALYTGAQSTASALVAGSDRQHGCEVTGLSLDELAKDHGIEHVDLLKVDIEGAEGDVLRTPGLLENVDRVVFEFHRRTSAASLWDILSGLPHLRVLRIEGDTENQALVQLAAESVV